MTLTPALNIDDPAALRAAVGRLAEIATEAGARIMDIYAGKVDVEQKSDGSPLTAADLAAEAVIAAGLAHAFPDIPVISEERAAVTNGLGAAGETFILVDPLDGTKEFVSRTGEFTVNIAIIAQHRPIAGVVFAPALNKLWAGVVGDGAWIVEAGARRPTAVRARPDQLTAVASRSHLDAETKAFLERLPIADSRSIGSSLKFCLVAEGDADVYPRFGPTMEWDTAAGQAVLEAAGGRVTQPDGAPFAYGKASAGYRNGSFVCWGG